MLTDNGEGILTSSWRMGLLTAHFHSKWQHPTFATHFMIQVTPQDNTSAVILILIWLPWFWEWWHISLCTKFNTSKPVPQYIVTYLMQKLKNPYEDIVAKFTIARSLGLPSYQVDVDVLLFLLCCHIACSICWFSPICPPTKSKV